MYHLLVWERVCDGRRYYGVSRGIAALPPERVQERRSSDWRMDVVVSGTQEECRRMHRAFVTVQSVQRGRLLNRAVRGADGRLVHVRPTGVAALLISLGRRQ